MNIKAIASRIFKSFYRSPESIAIEAFTVLESEAALLSPRDNALPCITHIECQLWHIKRLQEEGLIVSFFPSEPFGVWEIQWNTAKLAEMVKGSVDVVNE